MKCLENDNCEDKLVISMTLENSQLINSEKLSFKYDQFQFKDDNTLYKLDKPINITFAKSEVDILYKLSYISHFNSKVYEKVIKSIWPLCTEGLWNGDELFKDSTCNYKKNNKNELIENSQGFCCKCPELTILTGIKNGINRSDCGLFTSSETAHCLEFSPNWFGAYEIINKQYDYNIDINIDIPNDTEIIKKKIVISSNNRTVKDDSGILIKLVGDFLPLNPPPDLINNIVLLPQPKNITLSGDETINNNWLIVDKSMISLDGKECNKIGTSYDAFQSQRNKCKSKKGTCLNNQIEDLLIEDEKNIKNNKNAKYLLKSKGDFTEAVNKNNELNLKLKFKEIFTTQITFEINASKFKFLTNKGKGIIKYLKIDEFNSFNENGSMEIKIENIGNYTSKFEINPHCDDKIQKITSKIISLESKKDKLFNFKIFSLAPKGFNHTCNIFLNDSLGNLLDTKNLTFSSLETIQTSPHYNNTNLYNYTDTKNNENLINQLEIKKCELLCPESYNLFCIVINGCLSNFHKAILIYGCLLFIIVFLYLKLKDKCCCFRKKNQKNDKKKGNFNNNFHKKDDNDMGDNNRIENNKNLEKDYQELKIKLEKELKEVILNKNKIKIDLNKEEIISISNIKIEDEKNNLNDIDNSVFKSSITEKKTKIIKKMGYLNFKEFNTSLLVFYTMDGDKFELISNDNFKKFQKKYNIINIKNYIDNKKIIPMDTAIFKNFN